LKKLQTAVALVALVAASAFGLAALVSEPTQAAPVPAKPPIGPNDKAVTETLADMDAQLLLNRKVLREIKCDIDQLDKIMDRIEAAQLASQKKINEAWKTLNGAFDPENFQKMFQEAQEDGQKELRKAVAGVVADTLTPAQRKRLREIDLQS